MAGPKQAETNGAFPLGSNNVGRQEKQEPTLAGSVFINNTSYAGCDIKVVVNIYDTGKVAQEEIKKAQKELEKNQKELKEVRGMVTRSNDILSTLKPGTNEFNNISGTKQRAEDQVRALQINIEDALEKIRKLAKNTPTANTKVLAECQTISISTHREKMAVRSFGSVYPKAFVRSFRQIAGSLIFTVFNEDVLYEFLEADASDFDANTYTSAILDQIPPVDIMIAFANEYGQTSRMTIYGVEFVDTGQVMSVEDMITENVVSFVARDFDPMRSVGARKLDENSILMNVVQPKRASDLLLEEDYLETKEKLSPFTRFNRRRNPFL